MRTAHRTHRFASQDWATRNRLYMHGLQYNITDGYQFYWCGGSWRSFN